MGAVIGQRARHRISFGEALLTKVKRRKTLTYRTEEIPVRGGEGMLVCSYVCGPLHSAMYGVCGIALTQEVALKRLADNLQCNWGFFGKLRYGADEAIGLPDGRRSDTEVTIDA